MIRAILIAPDLELRSQLEARLAETGQMVLLRSFDRYLSFEEVQRFARAHSPHAVLLDVESNPAAIPLAANIARHIASAKVIALARSCDPALLVRLMNAGVREFLYPPFPKELYLEAVARLTEAVREAPVTSDSTDLLFAFLPAKAGSGCSTLAMNAAAAISRFCDGRVLLADLDFYSGIARFLLKLNSAFSVLDAMDRAAEIDEAIWVELVTRTELMDVLASGPIRRAFHPDPVALRRVFDYARRHYQAICVDLAGTLEEASVELLHEARRILLVIQPDLASVYLAKEKLRFLATMELEDRVSVVLNRWHRDACLSIPDIESVVGLPVQFTIGDDANLFYRSLLAGVGVDPGTEIGKEIARLGLALSETKSQKSELTPKRRMVEYFSLVPAKYSLFPSKQ
jgi:pilus assembly protein CpaE